MDTTLSDPAIPRSRFPAPIQILLSIVVLGLAITSPQLVTVLPPVRSLLGADPYAPAAVALTVVIQVLPTVLALILLHLLLRLDGRRTLAAIGWRRQRLAPLTLLAGIGVSLVVMLGAALLLRAAGLLRPVDPALMERYATTPVWVTVLSVLLTGFAVQAIPEELIFRGYLLRSLRMGRTAAILLSSGAFGVLHLISNGGQTTVLERILYLAMPLGFGFCAAVLSLRWDSIWAAIGVHGGVHLAYPVIYVFALGDGPWLWCVAGLGWAVAGVVATRVPAPPPGKGEQVANFRLQKVRR